ncbi:MAG TPA: hypothetical protein VLC09_16840 [Polyangiaceae bacterium]|nr:hypothetical protein [Polyangiaceae bacterium]
MKPASSFPFRLGRALAAAGFVVLLGCQPQIGDDCRRDLDCSQLRDRICDTTQAGGYCTQFNCSPTSCPKGESICVAFNNEPSTVPQCTNLGRTSPYVRNFCMRVCGSDGDCRDGYICMDMTEENPFGAAVVQKDPTITSVCVSPQSAEPIGSDRNNQVCTGAPEGGAGGGGGQGGSSQ